MVKKEELKKIVIRSQASEVNVYREYTQHLFLSNLYRLANTERILFKGGTALRIAYQSPRYSEDLDFSLFGISKNQLEEMILAVSENMQKNNCPNEIVEAKETTGGYLAELRTKIYGKALSILIQASRRKANNLKPNIQLIKNDFIPQYTLFLLPEKELVGEKIQAALTRAKPRDFFDVYFLLRQRLIPVDQRRKLLNLTKKIRRDKYEFEELSNFLPSSMTPLANDLGNILTAEIDKFAIKS